MLTCLLLGIASAYQARATTFTIPGAVLLFGSYNEIVIAAPDRTDTSHPPVEVGTNHGYFAYPSLSPRGDLVAWGFAREWQSGRATHRARCVLGLLSLHDQAWTLHGDFDDIKPTTFSPDGSQVAFAAVQQDQSVLVIFDVATHTMTTVPSAQGTPTTSMSWSPDAKHLAVETTRGGAKNLSVAILDLESGSVRPLAEGVKPAWSPNGEWIAYFDPDGAKCLVVHPDGTGSKL